MNVINDASFPRESQVAVVDRDHCDGCALCVDVCPADALQVRPNVERPGRRIVVVSVKACEGCGACQGTCPKEAIALPGLSNVRLRAYVGEAIAGCEAPE